MRLLRGVAGAVLWILAALLGLVAVILCVTVILLPVGLPLLGYARRLFTLSLRLILPRAVSHPVETAETATRKRRRELKKETAAKAKQVRKGGNRAGRKVKRARKKVAVG